MNGNNDAKCVSAIRRNLHRKNVDLRPLRLTSLLGVTMGVLMLMAMGAPSAHAQLATYYNFNHEADGTPPPYTSNTTDGTPPATQTTHLVNDATNPFPSGNMSIATIYPPPPKGSLPAGTLVNLAPGDATGKGGALDLAGNANLTSGGIYCFDLGGISTTGEFNITLSFAIASVGNGGQFKDLSIKWGTSNSATVPATTYTGTVTYTMGPPILGTNTHNNLPVYQQVIATLNGAGNQPAGTFVWIQFCFSNAGNNADGNDTLIDNIQVNGRVPEPTTAISGVLAAVGLFWCHRKRLSAVLRARLA